MKRLGEISDTFHYSLEEKEALVEVAMTTLSSKIVNRSHRPMAEIAVDAVLAVADIERKDVNLDLIKMDGKVGGRLEDTRLVRGIVVDAKTGAESGGELRELGMGAQILVDLGARRLRLVTNNPRKIVGLEGYGLEVVERLPIHMPKDEDNAAFLEGRREQLGHIIPDSTSS